MLKRFQMAFEVLGSTLGASLASPGAPWWCPGWPPCSKIGSEWSPLPYARWGQQNVNADPQQVEHRAQSKCRGSPKSKVQGEELGTELDGSAAKLGREKKNLISSKSSEVKSSNWNKCKVQTTLFKFSLLNYNSEVKTS